MALKNINRNRLPTHSFLREFRFLLSLEHPKIANCHALEQSASGRQLVLDYCEAGTLRSVMEQEAQLTLSEIMILMTEVLTALEHAHSQSIVHCDIKPENILLSLTPNSWQAKVSDFGIARLSQELKGNHSGATGSPAYMAPERFYYQHDASSDLYAVGIILYELLVGDRPFSGSHSQLMVAHLNHPVKIPETVPDALRTVLQKSLEKLIPRRFHSATEMKTAIMAARQTLTAAELRTHFPLAPATLPPSQFRPQQVVEIMATCQALCVSQLGSSQALMILAAIGNEVYGWPLAADNQLERQHPSQYWLLNGTIDQLLENPSGAIAVVNQTLYRLTLNQPPQVLAHFPDPIRLAGSSGRQLMVESRVDASKFWVVDPLKQLPVAPRLFQVAVSSERILSVALDERHFLVAQVEAQSTRLQVLTRWGKVLGTLSLHTPITQIASGHNRYQILAQGGHSHKDLLMIDLKPFRVVRCRTGIVASWLGQLIIGFASMSPTGQLRIVNFQGQVIGRVNRLPPPTAIAFQAPYHIWLATDQGETPRLHGIDIRKLDLDIVF